VSTNNPKTDLSELNKRITVYRETIDSIDLEIVNLLNKRAEAASHIGHIKKEYAVPVYVPAREEDVKNHVQKSNNGPLSNEAICRLFERIIDESRRLERETSHSK